MRAGRVADRSGVLPAYDKRLDPQQAQPELPAVGDTGVTVQLVDDARRRSVVRPYGRELAVTVASALGFVLATAALYVAFGGGHRTDTGVAAVLVLSYAVLSRIEFELGSGTVLPTELVLVPMLFLAPPAEVPVLVACGFVLGGLPEMLRRRIHWLRVYVRLSYSWYAIGPALVFAVARPGSPSWRDWPVYLLALAAQFALDAASSVAREWLAVGVRPEVLAPLLARAYLVDLLLAPIGLLAAQSAAPGGFGGFGFVAVLSLGGLLTLLASDRRERIDETIVLADAVEVASTAARVDGLTGLANRLAWDEHLVELETRPAANATPVSVVIADLNKLKLANDTRGHAFGDSLIQTTGALLSASVGAAGLVARLGGDEFAIAVPVGADRCDALVARLRSSLEAHPGLDGFPLSLSLGAASSPPEPTLAAAVAVADERMYAQKRSPRSRAFGYKT